jgi:hypothetical protein
MTNAEPRWEHQWLAKLVEERTFEAEPPTRRSVTDGPFAETKELLGR